MITLLTAMTTQPVQQNLLAYGGDDTPRDTCDGDLQETKRVYALWQTVVERNRIAREQIIDALGGPDACRAIPVVSLHNEDLQIDLSINDDYFPQGHWVIQGEDPAGRKFVALRVQLKEIQNANLVAESTNIQTTHIITIHQHQRETTVNGNYWTRSLVLDNPVHVDFTDRSDLSKTDDCLGGIIAIAGVIRNLRETGSWKINSFNRFIFGLGPQRIFIFDRAPKP